MANNYSKNQMKPLTIDGDSGLRTYKGFKLNAYQVTVEGFKILKAILPSLGTGIDQLSNGQDLYETPNTFGAMFQLLNENLSEDQFTTLVDKLLGSLVCNGEAIEDWIKHFDEYPQDLIEVISWAGGESFYSFFMESTMLKSKVKSIAEMLDPNLKEKISNVLKSKEQDTKEKD